MQQFQSSRTGNPPISAEFDILSTTNHATMNHQFSQASLWPAHVRPPRSLTFAPWMKKTFAFSARAASGDTTAANARSVAAIRWQIGRTNWFHFCVPLIIPKMGCLLDGNTNLEDDLMNGGLCRHIKIFNHVQPLNNFPNRHYSTRSSSTCC